MSTAATTAATAAAAAAKRRMLEEEERMTPYNDSDLEGWEFKIVRANTRKFKDAESVRRLCEEEAQAGWEMIEKFDDYRIRFKRRVDKRSNDTYLNVDPYRTNIGPTEGHIAAIAVGAIVLIALAGLLVAFWVR
jgi:hypothetical protein